MVEDMDRKHLKVISYRNIFWVIPLIFLSLFYLYPLGRIIFISIDRAQGAILTTLSETLFSAYFWRVTSFTFYQAVLSTLVTLCIGLPGAFYLGKYHFPGRDLFRALSSIPFIMPTIVTAMAFDALLGPRGWVNLLLMYIFQLGTPPITFSHTFLAIIVAHVFYNTTIILRIVGDFWGRLDARLTQAAQTLGSSPLQAFTKIVLPLISPAVASASLLVFIFNFTSFGVIMVLGGVKFSTLETEIYYQTVSLFNLPTAAILSLFQLCCTLTFTVLYLYLNQRYTTPLPLRSQNPPLLSLSSIRQKAIAIIVLGVISSWLILPLLACFMRSFVNMDALSSNPQSFSINFTLNHYIHLLKNTDTSVFYGSPIKALIISLSYALSTVCLSLLIGIPTAWLLVDKSPNSQKTMLHKSLDALIMLPLGTSAVTLGLGLIISFNKPPLDLRASVLLIPLAHTLIAFPFVVRSLVPALQSIQPRYREAAALCGASPRQIFFYIDLPLVLRAIIVAAAFAFTISLGEFGATSILTRPEYPTLPIMIFRFFSKPGLSNYSQGLALSSILMLLCAFSLLFIERFKLNPFNFHSTLN